MAEQLINADVESPLHTPKEGNDNIATNESKVAEMIGDGRDFLEQVCNIQFHDPGEQKP